MVLEVDRMIREWGEWEVLHSLGTTKVKKITVNPGGELSYQRHFHRNELWYVHQGHGSLILNYANEPSSAPNEEWVVDVGTNVLIEVTTWHQLVNVGKEPLIVIEIQYGDKCIEEDIERIRQ